MKGENDNRVALETREKEKEVAKVKALVAKAANSRSWP